MGTGTSGDTRSLRGFRRARIVAPLRKPSHATQRRIAPAQPALHVGKRDMAVASWQTQLFPPREKEREGRRERERAWRYIGVWRAAERLMVGWAAVWGPVVFAPGRWGSSSFKPNSGRLIAARDDVRESRRAQGRLAALNTLILLIHPALPRLP